MREETIEKFFPKFYSTYEPDAERGRKILDEYMRMSREADKMNIPRDMLVMNLDYGPLNDDFSNDARFMMISDMVAASNFINGSPWNPKIDSTIKVAGLTLKFNEREERRIYDRRKA